MTKKDSETKTLDHPDAPSRRTLLRGLGVELALPLLESPKAQADQEPTDYKFVTLAGAFEVNIFRRGPRGGPPFAALGGLSLKVNPVNGLFTGLLTPARDADTGNLLPATIFQGSPLLPDVTVPKELPCTGFINGNQLGFQFDLGVGDDGNQRLLTGVGLSQSPLLSLFDDHPTPTRASNCAGKASGPSQGDDGDWALRTVIDELYGKLGAVEVYRVTVYNPDGSVHCRYYTNSPYA